MNGGYLPWPGVPTLAKGCLPWIGGGATLNGGKKVPTFLARGYLPWVGYPLSGWMEYPLARVGTPHLSQGIHLRGRQSSTASTCYVADGMPLAFTQEDFLVFRLIRRKCIFYCLCTDIKIRPLERELM